LTVDIGGGSSQQVLTDASGVIVFTASAPVGVVALAARFSEHDPPTDAEAARLRETVAQTMAQTVPAARQQPELAVPIGGLGWRLRLAGGFSPGEPLQAAWIGWLARASVEAPSSDTRVFGGLTPDHADMVRAGANVLQATLEAWQLGECVVSDRGIR